MYIQNDDEKHQGIDMDKTTFNLGTHQSCSDGVIYCNNPMMQEVRALFPVQTFTFTEKEIHTDYEFMLFEMLHKEYKGNSNIVWC